MSLQKGCGSGSGTLRVAAPVRRSKAFRAAPRSRPPEGPPRALRSVAQAQRVPDSTCRGPSQPPPCPEGLPRLFGEELWLLERGEVPAPVDLIPVEQVGPQHLSPGLWRAEYLVRKDRRRHWQFDPSAGQARPAGAGVLPVDAGRRRGGVGEPVETDIVAHPIDRKPIFSIAPGIRPPPAPPR